MVAAKLIFNLSKKGSDKDCEVRDLIEGYLAGLSKYGNIWGEFVLSSKKKGFQAYTYLSHPNAMAKKYQTKHTKKDLENIYEKIGENPKCEILGDKIDRTVPKWKTESFLYIFTHAFDFTSPVCLGSSGKALPIYFLPLSAGDRERAYFWASSYRDHDRIWLSSDELEIPAYKQMVEPDSGLSKKGRKICDIVEKKTGIPTYYFLNRYWGRIENEDNRLCPRCGSEWRVEEEIAPSKSFSNFAFQCKPCRLVSCEADSFEDERHARIGEYKLKKSTDTD
ncbi:DUF2310 family Zn-ribbon-containing protein [Desulfobacterales bacterium HSG2]|nr:DUF2310 family Zn-ribbon-containing protein [Desulfobacterales bacterium HSG2]